MPGPSLSLPAGIAWAILAGCAHSPGALSRAPERLTDPAAPHPAWIDHVPHEAGVAFAVGIAGPTYYPDDGVKYASENGRAELAHVVSSHVTAATFAVTTTRGTQADTAAVVDATHDATDAIVRDSEVQEVWTDKEGRYSGQPGTTYALMRLVLAGNRPAAAGP